MRRKIMESYTVEATFTIASADAAARMWAIYAAAFRDAGTACIQEQVCYDAATLRDALADPDYAKFVLRDGGGIVAFCLATNDLEKARIAYVNPVRLRLARPDLAARRELWYVTALVVEPGHQGRNATDVIIAEIGAFMDARGGAVAFDFARDKHPQFPEYALHQFRKAKRTRDLSYDEPEYAELGGQTYGIISFAKKR
jgi:hypothetical protein